jgi:hypothetical protein
MEGSPRSDRDHPHVTIVADNPETLDGLAAYLRRAGIRTDGKRRLEDLADLPSRAHAGVIVVFPDDFHSTAVMAALAALCERSPESLKILVTRDVKRFERLPTRDGALAPLIVPKPVWGWTILDAIRARVEPELGSIKDPDEP